MKKRKLLKKMLAEVSEHAEHNAEWRASWAYANGLKDALYAVRHLDTPQPEAEAVLRQLEEDATKQACSISGPHLVESEMLRECKKEQKREAKK